MRSRAIPVAVLLLSAACLPAGAQVPPSLHACASIPSDSERLACFDREDARLSGSSSKPAAQISPASHSPPAAAPTLAAAPAQGVSKANPQAPAVSATPAATATPPSATPAAASAASLPPPEQTFGLTGDQLLKLEARQQGMAPPPKLKNLTAQVASVSQNSTGRWVMTLDNGQVWRQTQDQRDFAISPGDPVKISTGAMGSFWLQTNRHNWVRVERVL